MQVVQKYRPFSVAGWNLIIVGFGIATLFSAASTTAQWVGYQVVVAAGLGLIVRSRLSNYTNTQLTTLHSTLPRCSPSWLPCP